METLGPTAGGQFECTDVAYCLATEIGRIKRAAATLRWANEQARDVRSSRTNRYPSSRRSSRRTLGQDIRYTYSLLKNARGPEELGFPDPER